MSLKSCLVICSRELEELLGDLLEGSRLHVDHDRDAAEALVVGGGHGEGVDVEPPPGEQPRHPGQHPGLVLHQHGEDVVAGLGVGSGHVRYTFHLDQ